MPSAHESLLDFIGAMKGQGASDDFIVSLLRQNGWSEKRIYQAFGHWYETRTGSTVPNGGGRVEAAKDAFLYLLAFITLGIWTIQLGSLLFTAIDGAFPNPALDRANATWVTSRLANELASVIVAFPLFIFVTRSITHGIRLQPERLESSVRKWLTYIALVITASTMICDLVTFLAYLLRGDLDTRFLLKVFTVLVVAGGVFAYYLDSQRSDTGAPGRNRWSAIAASALVGFSLILGFRQIGSPTVQRSASEDTRRLFDLSTIAQGLHMKWQTHGQSGFELPATIQEVSTAGAPADSSILDPATRLPYQYEPFKGSFYRLCATFSRPSPNDVPHQWRHSAGRACFSLDASEEVALVQRSWQEF